MNAAFLDAQTLGRIIRRTTHRRDREARRDYFFFFSVPSALWNPLDSTRLEILSEFLRMFSVWLKNSVAFGIVFMKQWRFEVFNKAGFNDVQGNSTLSDIKELGITAVQAVQFARVYLIEADFDNTFAERIGKELLADPVCEDYYIGRSVAPAGLAKATLIEVHLKSG